jgi:sugar lactone lactonase YvrE
VIDPTGKVLAKLGDFQGINKHGIPQGLLFPASLAVSPDGRTLYVTNLALDLRVATGSPTFQTSDSQWTDQVQRYTVSSLKTNFKPLGR